MVPESARKACEFGLEGLVSKHRDWPNQSGRSSFGVIRHRVIRDALHQIHRSQPRQVMDIVFDPRLLLRQRRPPPRSVSHGRCGHNARAPDGRGFASGVEAATEELKLLLVVGGVGHEFFRM